MEFHLTAMMKRKAEEEKNEVFLNWEQGRDISNTMVQNKKKDADGNQTEDDITVKNLFQRFEEYCRILLQEYLALSNERAKQQHVNLEHSIRAYWCKR